MGLAYKKFHSVPAAIRYRDAMGGRLDTRGRAVVVWYYVNGNAPQPGKRPSRRA